MYKIILQFYLQEYAVAFILRNPQIEFGNFIGRMIENIHQHRRRYALFPSMIAKSLAQGMAADMRSMYRIFRSRSYNSIRLRARQGHTAILLRFCVFFFIMQTCALHFPSFSSKTSCQRSASKSLIRSAV